jgi:hypothetical protein
MRKRSGSWPSRDPEAAAGAVVSADSAAGVGAAAIRSAVMTMAITRVRM